MSAPTPPPPPENLSVFWDIEVEVPAARLVLLRQSVEWVVPPEGVDPREYAQDFLRLLLSGLHPIHGRAFPESLAPGLMVRCTVRRAAGPGVTGPGAILGQVEHVVPDRPEPAATVGP